MFEAVGVVEDLDIVFVAFGQVNRIFVFPVVVVLMESAQLGAAPTDVHGRMAEVVLVADGIL